MRLTDRFQGPQHPSFAPVVVFGLSLALLGVAPIHERIPHQPKLLPSRRRVLKRKASHHV
jgi:hypothetical protein